MTYFIFEQNLDWRVHECLLYEGVGNFLLVIEIWFLLSFLTIFFIKTRFFSELWMKYMTVDWKTVYYKIQIFSTQMPINFVDKK